MIKKPAHSEFTTSSACTAMKEKSNEVLIIATFDSTLKWFLDCLVHPSPLPPSVPTLPLMKR